MSLLSLLSTTPEYYSRVDSLSTRTEGTEEVNRKFLEYCCSCSRPPLDPLLFRGSFRIAPKRSDTFGPVCLDKQSADKNHTSNHLALIVPERRNEEQ